MAEHRAVDRQILSVSGLEEYYDEKLLIFDDMELDISQHREHKNSMKAENK